MAQVPSREKSPPRASDPGAPLRPRINPAPPAPEGPGRAVPQGMGSRLRYSDRSPLSPLVRAWFGDLWDQGESVISKPFGRPSARVT